MIVIAIIAILAMSAPAMADTVDTNVDVGTDSTAPYMIALTMTPDDTPGTTNKVEVDPEFAIPDAGGVFPPTVASQDGWKLVKFYIEVGHTNGIENIDSAAIDVTYPASFADPGDAALFGARAGQLKFEINVNRSVESSTGWAAQIVYPYAESYPGPVAATLPALKCRPLVYASTSFDSYDQVDVDADDIYDGTDSPPDLTWQNFLTAWGTRVKYATDEDALSAFDKYQLGQALVLEISGWMWFHEPGVLYTVAAKASTAGGAVSPSLVDGTKFLNYNRLIGLFIDFDTVNYGPVNIGGTSWAMGDRFLNSPDLPTVWNNGNASAQVLISSTKMVKDYTGDEASIHGSIYYSSAAKTIAHFDAKLYYTNGTGTPVQIGEIDYVADSTPEVIAVGGIGGNPVLLQACRPAKIEFSVEPELGESQEAGQYAGFLTLSVAPYTGTQTPTP